jgi:hypothetical protein
VAIDLDLLTADPVGVSAVQPGTVCLRVTSIHEAPCEDMSRADAGMRGGRIVEQVLRFLAGSPLAGLVEVDLLTRRSRVTLALRTSPPVAVSVVPSRLHLTTAAEVVDAMRMRAELG